MCVSRKGGAVYEIVIDTEVVDSEEILNDSDTDMLAEDNADLTLHFSIIDFVVPGLSLDSQLQA